VDRQGLWPVRRFTLVLRAGYALPAAGPAGPGRQEQGIGKARRPQAGVFRRRDSVPSDDAKSALCVAASCNGAVHSLAWDLTVILGGIALDRCEGRRGCRKRPRDEARSHGVRVRMRFRSASRGVRGHSVVGQNSGPTMRCPVGAVRHDGGRGK